jgi:hypothetical protein
MWFRSNAWAVVPASSLDGPRDSGQQRSMGLADPELSTESPHPGWGFPRFLNRSSTARPASSGAPWAGPHPRPGQEEAGTIPLLPGWLHRFSTEARARS